MEAEQEFLSNNLSKKLQKTIQEKTELENQLSRSRSLSRTSSIGSGYTSISESPSSTPGRGWGVSEQAAAAAASGSLPFEITHLSCLPLSPGKSLNNRKSHTGNEIL